MIFPIRAKVGVTKHEMSALGDLTSLFMPRIGFGLSSMSSGICVSYYAVNFIDMIGHFSLGVLAWGSNAICIDIF